MTQSSGCDANTWCRIGTIAHQEGKLPEALDAFVAACDICPTSALAWNGRAVILSAMGREEEARRVLQDAFTTTGGDLSILTNLAILHEQLGSHQEAIVAAGKILASAPDNSAARQTLGLALLRSGQTAEAAHHFRQLTADQPDNPEAYLNLGETLMAADEYSAARDAYSQAIALNPALITARVGLGQALAMLGQFDAADALLIEATRIDPQGATACFQRMAAMAGQRIPFGWQARAIEVMLSRRWAQQKVCDWAHRDDYIRVIEEYANHLVSTGEAAYDPSLVFQSGQLPIALHHRRSLLDAVARGVIIAAGEHVRRRKYRLPGPLRLGFISADFYDTPIAQLHWRQLALHDRSRFSVHAYSLIDRQGSKMRKRIVESVDYFHDLSQATAIQAAWKIARDGIDILIDVTGHAENARPEILALRPASVNLSLMGGITPTGKQFVDYRIGDSVATANAAEFSEALVLLPETHFIYNDQEPIAADIPTRQEFGLPEEGFVFCGFNSAFKIEPMVFDAWMSLLRDIPGSVLWLGDSGQTMIDNLRREATSRGVNGDRIIFAPRLERSAHLARHVCADLFLDTWICNAGTTAADALWAGLPVLTRAGNSMGSRIAASLVTAAGLPELVVDSAEDYYSWAYRLATSPDMLQSLRLRLIEKKLGGELFNTQRKVKQLERGFEMVWERHLCGAPPATFSVPKDA